MDHNAAENENILFLKRMKKKKFINFLLFSTKTHTNVLFIIIIAD